MPTAFYVTSTPVSTQKTSDQLLPDGDKTASHTSISTVAGSTPPMSRSLASVEIGRGLADGSEITGSCTCVILRGLSKQSCIISSSSLADTFGCDELRIAEHPGYYSLHANGQEFTLSDTGVLYVPPPPREHGNSKTFAPHKAGSGNSEIARLVLVSGKIVFTPPQMQPPLPFNRLPDSATVDYFTERVSRNIVRASQLLMKLLKIPHSSHVPELIGQCHAEALQAPPPTTDSPELEGNQHPHHTEASQPREVSEFRLMSDGSLFQKTRSKLLFRRCNPGNPRVGFVWSGRFM